MSAIAINDYINQLKNKGSSIKVEQKIEEKIEEKIEQKIAQNTTENNTENNNDSESTQSKKESFLLRKYLNEKRDFVKKLNNKVKNERYKQNVVVKEFTTNNEFNEIVKNSKSNDIFKKSWGRLNKELKILCFKKYMNNLTDIDLTAIDKNNLLKLLIILQEDKILSKTLEYNIEEGKIENINNIYFYKLPILDNNTDYNIIYEDFRNFFNNIQTISIINQNIYDNLLNNLKNLLKDNLDLKYNYFIFNYALQKEPKEKKTRIKKQKSTTPENDISNTNETNM